MRGEDLGGSVNLNFTGSVVSVFDLHLSVSADIDVTTVVTFHFEVVLHSHVHIERLVGLVLTVRNACLLHGSSLVHGVLHAVEAAFSEQEAR